MEKSFSSPVEHLPVQPFPLVGREREIHEISDLLTNPQNRLITVHGFGGCGKTRLAVEIGKFLADRFSDGVWFVPLAPLQSSGHILTATASALGLDFGSSVDQKAQLFRFLQGKNLLLVFDNLEHLLPDAAPFIDEILGAVYPVHLLVTSRQPINISWEWAYALRGLEYQQEPFSHVERMSPAVELFLQHLRRGGQPVGEGEAACAAQISKLVNGLPLALLMAASWGRALGCDEIAREIKRGIQFLQNQRLSLPEKHSSMQAVFDYSWRLLSEKEQTILRRLSVFRGGFDRAAANAVTGASLLEIASLIDHSLVDRVANDRYQIHELLRQYLQDQLQEAGEDQSTRDWHLAYFLNLCEQAEPELYREPQNAWIDRLKVEIDNIASALEWTLESQDPPHFEKGLRLLVSTERIWILPLFTKTGFSYLVQLLELIPQDPYQHPHGRGLNLAGWLSYLLEKLPESRQYTAQALEIGRRLNDSRLVGDAYHIQSLEAFYRKDYGQAQSFAQKSLTCYQEINDAPGTLKALDSLGRCGVYNGDFSTAKVHLNIALDLAKKLGDIRTQYSILRGLGELGMLGPVVKLRQAQAYFQEGLVVARQFNDKYYIGHTLNSLGEIARMEGQFEQASRYYEQAIMIDKELGLNDEVILHELNLAFAYLHLGNVIESKLLFLKNLELALNSDHLSTDITTCLLGLACVAVVEGETRLAATFLGEIDSTKESLLFSPPERSDYERTVAAAKTQLSDHEFVKLFKEGQALGLVQAARSILDNQAVNNPKKAHHLNGLTAREIEVLRLITNGLSDQEVATRLVISPRTVNAHLTSIYSKLDVDSRGAAARFAREKGLA